VSSLPANVQLSVDISDGHPVKLQATEGSVIVRCPDAENNCGAAGESVRESVIAVGGFLPKQPQTVHTIQL
jgi:hypothetical protein